jgi:eukaryotic-like serine/threonine-protein kinase
MTENSAANERLKNILKAGKLFEGKYRIMRPLGAGSFAIVVHARHEVMERDVALKFLKPKVVESNPEVSERFIREVKIASKLKHPNVVTIFDFGTADDDLYYMVQEYVAGTTLDAVLTSQGAFAPERVIHIAAQVLDCLTDAHSLGIIHRDLKPANIMLTSHNGDDDFTKILDFGVAKLLDAEDTKSGVSRQSTKFIGTPIYMSPEQILGREVQPASDLYSMGLILYEMATGQAPIQADRVAEVVQQHLSDEPLAFPRLHLLPEHLAKVILRATSRQPKDRYRSATAFRLALLGEASAGDTSEDLEPLPAVEEERDPSLWRRPASPSRGVSTLPANARVASSPGVAPAPQLAPPAAASAEQDIFSGRNYIDVDDFTEGEFEPAGHFSPDAARAPAPKPMARSGLSASRLTESAVSQPGFGASPAPPSEQSARIQRPANLPPSEQSVRIQQPPAFAQAQHPAPSVEPTTTLPSKLEIDHSVRRQNRKDQLRGSRRSPTEQGGAGMGSTPDSIATLGLYGLALFALFVEFVVISAVLDGIGGPLRMLFGLSPLIIAVIWTQYNRFGKAVDLHRDWLMPVAARLVALLLILTIGLAITMPARAEIALRHEGVWFLASFGEGAPWSFVRGPTGWLTTKLADLYAVLPWR